MCGRFVQARAAIDLASDLGAEISDDIPPASFNVAPTQNIAILLRRNKPQLSGRELHRARWGLIPSWAPDASGPPLFNARIETVSEKPSFRDSIDRRCLVPISGYYEWQATNGGKIPHFIHAAEQNLLLAGLYRWWRPAGSQNSEDWLLTTTILTKPASASISKIHDRMPVFISSEMTDTWLDPALATDGKLLLEVGHAADVTAVELNWHRVSQRVGSVRNNSADLTEKVE